MNKKIPLLLWLVLILEFLFIFFFLFNYDLAWMNPEKFGTHQWILSNGTQWQAEDWGKFLNIDVIEYNPDRLSRPLSNFVEVVNAKWRGWAWNFILPHPAVSLIWPFMFILLPFLLYLTLVNMGCYPSIAFIGICIYLSSVGFLGPLVMLFHPAKNLVNLFAVLSMFLFSLQYKKMTSTPNYKEGGLLWAGFISLYLGFISDETGLYVYMMILFLFHHLWRQLWLKKDYAPLVGLVSLPFLYLLTIKCLLPALHWIVRHKAVHLDNYESYPSIKELFWPNWNNLWDNTKLLFGDHPHWWFNYDKFQIHPVLWCLQVIYLVLFIAVLIIAGRVLLKKHTDKNFLLLTGLGILLMLGYCFFQTFQLSKNAKIWGIWWYGSLFSLIYTLTLVFFLQFVLANKQNLSKWVLVLAAVFVLHGLVFTSYRIAIFKKQNLNRDGFKFEDIFHEKMDVYQYFNFKDTLGISSCKKMYTYLYWQKWRSKPANIDPAKIEACKDKMQGDVYFPIESIYLHIELK